jgi:hypothetical protein
MNYTGYGNDPNYIYSFRPVGGTIGGVPINMQSIGAREGYMQSLRNSLAYRQAGMEGKQRMEKVVSMGLPFNTDINKIQKVGYDWQMRRNVYAAPRPQPWGTWGPMMKTSERTTSGLTSKPLPPLRDKSPRDEAPKGYIRNKYGYLEPEEWYTEDDSGALRKKTEQEFRRTKKNTKTP